MKYHPLTLRLKGDELHRGAFFVYLEGTEDLETPRSEVNHVHLLWINSSQSSA